MKEIVKRYPVTPWQRRWALDIVHRLLLLERESTKDRGLRFAPWSADHSQDPVGDS
jgi:hypothetical protein